MPPPVSAGCPGTVGDTVVRRHAAPCGVDRSYPSNAPWVVPLQNHWRHPAPLARGRGGCLGPLNHWSWMFWNTWNYCLIAAVVSCFAVLDNVLGWVANIEYSFREKTWKTEVLVASNFFIFLKKKLENNFSKNLNANEKSRFSEKKSIFLFKELWYIIVFLWTF